MRSKKVSINGLMMTVSLISCCIGAYAINNGYKTASGIEQKISLVTADLKDKKETVNKAAESASVQYEIYEDAETKGKQIAELQNGFKKVIETAPDENGISQSYQETANALKALYVPGTDNAPNPWFYGDLSVLNPEGWKFISSWKEDNGLLPVAWYLTDKDSGDLLAFALADYNTTEKLFQSIKYGVTAEGGKYNTADPVQSNLTEEDHKTIEETLDDINNAEGDTDSAEYIPEENISSREDSFEKFLEENPDIAKMYGR